jgi:hypothetical protein
MQRAKWNIRFGASKSIISDYTQEEYRKSTIYRNVKFTQIRGILDVMK